MQNSNSPPSYGQPGQAPPGAATRPSWAGQQGGPQGMPGGIEAWRQRMAQMPRQPRPEFSGPAGIGAAAGMIANRIKNRGQAPQMPGGAQPMPPMQEQAPAQPPMPQAPAASAAPPQQTGMAGLGQAARGLYDKARVNALRGGGGRGGAGNMQEV